MVKVWERVIGGSRFKSQYGQKKEEKKNYLLEKKKKKIPSFLYYPPSPAAKRAFELSTGNPWVKKVKTTTM